MDPMDGYDDVQQINMKENNSTRVGSIAGKIISSNIERKINQYHYVVPLIKYAPSLSIPQMCERVEASAPPEPIFVYPQKIKGDYQVNEYKSIYDDIKYINQGYKIKEYKSIYDNKMT